MGKKLDRYIIRRKLSFAYAMPGIVFMEYLFSFRLRRSIQLAGQFEETVPSYGHDPAGQTTHRSSHALLSGLPNSRNPIKENCPLVPTVYRTTVEPESL